MFHFISQSLKVSIKMFDTFSNSSLNLMVLVKYDSFTKKNQVDVMHPKDYEIVGALMYHFNPCLGSFIPVINISTRFQGKHWGSNLLCLLYQYLIIQATNMTRLLIWFHKAKEHFKLISFYRWNGFHVTLPLFPNIQHLLP